MIKMKKLLSLAVAFVFFAVSTSLATNASAFLNENEKPVVYERQYEYATEVEDLLDLATPDSVEYSTQQGTDLANAEVTQLISTKTLADGTIQKEYASSKIALVDAERSSIETTPVNTNDSKYWGKYDIAVTVTAYYTAYLQEIYEGYYIVLRKQLHYTTCVINDANALPVYVSKLEMSSHGIYDPLNEPNIERFMTINNPTSGYVYRLNSDDSRIYDGTGMQYLYSGAVITLSDGTVSGNYDLMVILY